MNSDDLPVSASVIRLRKENEERQKQRQLDEDTEKRLNEAQRHYVKCALGRCSDVAQKKKKKKTQTSGNVEEKKVPKDAKGKPRKKKFEKNFVDQKAHSAQLAKLFVEKGRKKRLENLRRDIADLELKIKLLGSREHAKEIEENYRKIEEHLQKQSQMTEKISKAKTEIGHLKSQILRLNRKSCELAKQTESEDQYAEHFRRANRELENFKSKIEVSLARESKVNVENRQLRQNLKDMLLSRSRFNATWRQMSSKLRHRKKFLLDMIDRSSNAFGQCNDSLETYMRLFRQRIDSHAEDAGEMQKLMRKVTAKELMAGFLSAKGKRRELAPLQACEISRRAQLKEKWMAESDFYGRILKEVNEVLELPPNAPLEVTEARVERVEDCDFQFYKFLNHQAVEIESALVTLERQVKQIAEGREEIEASKNLKKSEIEEFNRVLMERRERTAALREESAKIEALFGEQCRDLQEIVKMCKVNTDCFKGKLARSEKIDIENFEEYFVELEKRLCELVDFVYCDERAKINADFEDEGENFVVKSRRSKTEASIIEIGDLIKTQECPECAYYKDMTKNENEIVRMLEGKAMVEAVRERLNAPETIERIHPLTSCKLPHSNVVASRRYAD